MNTIKKFIVGHKITSAIILVAIVLLGYYVYGKYFGATSVTKYVLSAVERGTLVVSVSGSGQVAATDQVDVKPKVSGDIVYVAVVVGQQVKAGTLIASLDTTDAEKAVRDAQTSLETAQLSLEKLKQPADALALTQSDNSLARAKESKSTAEDDLARSYDDGFNTTANAFLELPAIISGLQDMLYSGNVALGGASQTNLDYYAAAAARYDDKANAYRDDADAKYQAARLAYEKNFQDYKLTSRFSDKQTIENLIYETYNTTRSIAEAIKSANNLIQFYEDRFIEHKIRPAVIADTHLATLSSNTGRTNTYLTSLLSAKNSIEGDKTSITNADRSITENTESAAKLRGGPDALDLRSSELSVTQRENALLDAKQKLADYYVRAPFDGVIAVLNARKGDAASSGTVIATVIGKQRTANIPLNEVDVAKVKVGQKATLTFDAIPDLSMVGQVSEVGAIGTVSQGVVNYAVKIVFSAEDDRVKPSMSVSAAIITDVRQNIILAENAAVKSQGDTYYVDIVPATSVVSAASGTSSGASANSSSGVELSTAPIQRAVEVGLSNDSQTEIVSGLAPGEQVVLRTIATTATTQAPSILSAVGGNNRGAAGGGATRALGR